MNWRERFEIFWRNLDLIPVSPVKTVTKEDVLNFQKSELSTLFDRIETEVIGEDGTYMNNVDESKSFANKVLERNQLRAELRQKLSTLRSEYGVKEE